MSATRPAHAGAFTVAASDSLFEESVRVTWSEADMISVFYRISRIDTAVSDTTMLSVAAANDSIYFDATGVPGTEYEYCVEKFDVDTEALLDEDCDSGSRILFAPSNVQASDGEYADQIRLTWFDRSEVEEGFRIYRKEADESDDEFESIAELDPNVQVYSDTGAEPGVTYEYCVVVFDESDNESESACDSGERGFILAPGNVQATDGIFTDKVVINWEDRTDDELRYRIYRNGALLDSLAADSESYVDSDSLGTPHEYSVASVREVIATSDTLLVESAWVSDTGIGGDSTLVAPTNVVASDRAFDDRVQITWSDPSNLEDQFFIARDDSLIGQVDANSTVFDDFDLAPGETANYCVWAVSDSGGVSTQVCAEGTRAVVLAPTNVAASDGEFETHVEVTWESSSTSVVLFRIERDGTAIKSVSGDQRSCSDFGIMSGEANSYEYCVTAVTAHEEESAAACDTGYRELSSPTEVDATDDLFEDRVLITWSDESAAEAGYHIYAKTSGSGVVDTLATTDPNREAFLHETGVPGTRYGYEVVAFDALGISAAVADSGSRSLRPPTSLEASQGEYEDRIVLFWEDNSDAETGYEIVRDDGASDEVDANVTTWVDDDVDAGDTHSYEVSAIDDFGGSESVDVEGFTTIQPPGSVNATEVYFDEVIVTWIDRSDVETAYRVFRDDVDVSSTLSSNSTQYVDDTAVPGTEYTYCVRAERGTETSEEGCDDGKVLLPVSTDTPLTALTETVTGSSGRTSARFGRSVAFGGEYALVGAPEGPNSAVGAGVVYSFKWNGSEWTELQRFSPHPRNDGDAFGQAIAMDGRLAIIGAPHDNNGGDDEGSAHVYEFDPSTEKWTKIQTFIDPNPQDNEKFGSAVAIHGETILIQSHRNSGAGGRVFLYEREADGEWPSDPTADLAPAADRPDWGISLDLSDDYVLIGDPDKAGGGAVAVYARTADGSWEFSENLTLDDSPAGARFGSSLDLDGDLAIATTLSTLTSGGVERGVVFELDRDSGTWSQLQEIAPSGDKERWGDHVALDDGVIVVATTPGIQVGQEGDFHVYARSPETGLWSEIERIEVAGGNSSSNCALSGGHLLLGLPGKDGNTGALYPYEVLAQPAEVAATDGIYDGRVQVRWVDRSPNEDGFRILRDGVSVGEVRASIQSFDDFDAVPGQIHEYCVVAYTEEGIVSSGGCDFGWALPDGSITGRVSTLSGAPVRGVEVCLDPSPNRSLLLDGDRGLVRIHDPAMPDTALTVELWVKTSVDATDGGTPFSYATESEVDAFMIRNTSDLRVRIMGNNSSSLGSGVNDGDWHHVAATWRSSDGRAQLFVDGLLENTFTLATGETIEAGGLLVLGQEQNSGGFQASRALEGQIDEVRIWDTVRDSSEIRAAMTTSLHGDEEDLVAYWPIDSGNGPAVADLSAGNRYGTLEGGAFWTGDASPLEVCALTDDEGNYALSGIRYGGGTEFRVVPNLEPRLFSPAFKRIVLSAGNPVQNEIAFNDITSFSLSGTVKYEGVSCFVEGATILVDGSAAGITNGSGYYNVATQPGSHTIEVDLGDHTFEVPSATVSVDENITGLDFIDTTKRRLTGRVGGGCNLPIGTVTISIASESGCDDPIVVESTAAFDVTTLRPQKYIVRVTDVEDVPSALDRADILRFFENLGPQIVDLTSGDSTQDFIYRAPLSIQVEGFPDPACDGQLLTDPETGIQFPGVPIIAQGKTFPLTIRVFEDYGDGNLCPVDSGTVSIFDEIIDEADEPTVLSIEDGQVEYTTAGNTPNIFVGRRDAQGNDRSYQKPLTVVANVQGLDSVQQIHWAIVTGTKPRSGTFVTASAEEIPLLILRDPPGDGSYAFIEEGRTRGGEFTLNFAQSVETQLESKLTAGVQFEKGLPSFTTETRFGTAILSGWRVGFEATQSGTIRWSATTTERIATSDGDTFVGDGADVFMGVGLNLVFAKSDDLEINEDNCQIERSQSVVFGGDPDNPIETVYMYTENHIDNILIPQLVELAELEPDSSEALLDHVENWEQHLKLNRKSKRDVEFDENRSFSAGADFEYEKTSTTAESFEISVKVFAGTEAGATFDFFDSGSGSGGEIKTTWNFEMQLTGGGEFEQTNTIGYRLSDDDIGDYFSVDIGTDPEYRTPIFDLKSGRSSCPWEPGSQPRDSTIIAIEPPVQDGVAPDEAAVFTLSLTNASPSEELREYMIMPVQTANPSGAILSINGQPFNSGRSFFVDSGQTQEVTLTVERGPRRYFYEDLAIQVVPPCEFENFRDGGALQLSDDVSFSVGFAAPCSDVTLFEPTSGWTFDLEDSDDTDDRLRLTLDDFELQLSETDSLGSVGAEYRRVNTEDWIPVGPEIQRSNLPTFPNGDPKSVEIYWDVAAIPDGAYEIQAFTRCSAGRAFSTVATGVIDRSPPVTLGTPQPADTVLALGDEILVKFNEKIDCDTVTPDRVTLTYVADDSTVANVAFETSCDGRTIVLSPNEAQLALLEGRVLTARVESIEDIVGNPMELPVAWSFEVRQGAFTWTEESVFVEAAYRSPGELAARIVNGTPNDLDFELSGLPDWLTTDLTTGNIVAGQNLDVVFAISDTLPEGTHLATVLANVPDAANPVIVAPLDVRVDVACRPPSWIPRPSSYEHSMTAVLALRIDGAISNDSTDVVAGFVGNQLRGVARPIYVESTDQYMAFMTLYSNRAAGENVRFQIFDASDCRLYAAADRVLRFEADRRHGTPEVPVVLEARDAPAGDPQSVPVSTGWTWFSLNKIHQDMSIFNVLGDLTPRSGDLVKSQTAFSQYDGTAGWLGDLDNLDVKRTYAIRLSEAGTILHEGAPANPEIPIPVVDGWNWVGYPPNEPQEVNQALANLTPADGDVIKSQHEFAEYVESEELWIGNLEVMAPGRGYKLYLDDALQSSSFLWYPTPTEPLLAMDGTEDVGLRAATAASHRAKGSGENDPGWTLSSGYQFNMTVTARLQIDEDDTAPPGSVLGAFVGGELRGVTEMRHVPALGQTFAFLVVQSNVPEGETVEFHLYDTDRDEVLEVAETMTFSADLVGGSAQTPLVFHAVSSEGPGGIGTRPLSFSLDPSYPSPARAGAPLTLRWALPTQERVVLDLYDIQGRKVTTWVDERMAPGWYSREVDVAPFPSGVYFYRIQAGPFGAVSKLMILK